MRTFGSTNLARVVLWTAYILCIVIHLHHGRRFVPLRTLDFFCSGYSYVFFPDSQFIDVNKVIVELPHSLFLMTLLFWCQRFFYIRFTPESVKSFVQFRFLLVISSFVFLEHSGVWLRSDFDLIICISHLSIVPKAAWVGRIGARGVIHEARRSPFVKVRYHSADVRCRIRTRQFHLRFSFFISRFKPWTIIVIESIFECLLSEAF